MGGLITQDWQHRFSLFHLKFYEYLRQDEERSDKEYIIAIDEERRGTKNWLNGVNRGIYQSGKM